MYLLEATEWPKGSQASSGVWRVDSGLLSRSCRLPFHIAIYLIYLGRKVMTNLDSILKSRDITLSTKVCIVKAMVFPVVMYGCESWTIGKLSTEELMLLNCGVGEDS